jgi:hypothetical protein
MGAGKRIFFQKKIERQQGVEPLPPGGPGEAPALHT